MMNQKRAFNRYTTCIQYLSIYQEGFWDADRVWVGDSWLPAVPFACTPVAYGDRDSGVIGQRLKATEIGERRPAFMQVHSITEMPMKSKLIIYGISYKVIEILDYSAANFYAVICAKDLET